MSLFLSLFLASTFGSFLGNLAVFSVIGAMAKRVEKKQLEEFKALQRQMMEAVEKENQRMRKYASLES